MDTINALEDAQERQQNIHLISYDKKKAFDSPFRRAGLAIAYRRVGIPADTVNFLLGCDEHAIVYPKSPYFLLNKKQAKGFTCNNGVAQGDAPSGLHYALMEDITLCFISDNHKEVDTYLVADAYGYCRYQSPKLFVDDLTTYHASSWGAQAMVNRLTVTGIILNINLNPKKCRHLRMEWGGCPQHKVGQSSRVLLPNPTDYEIASYLPDGSQEGFPIIPHSETYRILGALISTGNDTSKFTTRMRERASTIASTMLKKQTSIHDISPIMHSAVFPSLAYPLQFASLSAEQMQSVAAPLRNVIRTKAHIKMYPNAVAFNGGATPYGEAHQDLADYVQGRKYGIYLRMAGGNEGSKLTMQSLIHRATRQMNSDSIVPQTGWVDTPHCLDDDTAWKQRHKSTPPPPV